VSYAQKSVLSDSIFPIRQEFFPNSGNLSGVQPELLMLLTILFDVLYENFGLEIGLRIL